MGSWAARPTGFQFPDNTVQTTAFSPAGYVPSTRQVATTGGLQGGGDLSVDRTLSIATAGAPCWSTPA
jgi:hypothetical protein